LGISPTLLIYAMVRLSVLLVVRYPFIPVLSFFSLAGLGALNGAGVQQVLYQLQQE
jgi:hypothetical protein